MDVSFIKESGPDAVVARLWLYRVKPRKGGPQSDGLAELAGEGLLFSPPRPNPASGTTMFEYFSAVSARVTLRIYDPAGRLIRTLVDREEASGPHRLTWDGKDDIDQKVRSGVYFARLRIGNSVATRKLVLIK